MAIPKLTDLRDLTDGLKQYETLDRLYASDFFEKAGDRLREVLESPHSLRAESAQPKVRDFLRIVHWNIERGNNFDGVLDALRNHPELKHADLLLLNEVDVGMVRTGNRHVAADLARALEMNFIYGAEYIELTKGIREEVNLRGENASGLHGNAILSRYPLSNARLVPLPCCFEPFTFHEKRFGRRIGLVVDVTIAGRVLTAATTHLEVRNSPQCRARQIRAIVDQIDQWKLDGPVVLGGDFNSNTFARGTLTRTARGAFRILTTPGPKLLESLRHPYRQHEPLFQLLARHGFEIEGFNDFEATAHVKIKGVEDLGYLPGVLKRTAIQMIPAYHSLLPMRLDWIAARGLQPLGDDDVADHRSKIASQRARTLPALNLNGRPLSDHDPIVVDVRLPP